MGDGKRKIRLLFVWHMHQPDYLDPERGEVVLPWVRLHGCKGYADMPFHLSRHPGVKATFNFSGTLLRQLARVSAQGGNDRYTRLSMKPPQDLTYEEKGYILKHFFSLSPQTIKISKRYYELLGKRGRSISESSMPEIIKAFDDGDFMDLQVLFNLMWFGRAAREEHPWLGELAAKGKQYDREEKERLLELQKETAAGVLGRYTDLLESGRIEISMTPHFHPILPLLIDSNSAAEGLPGVPLPERFSASDDAHWHVEEAAAAFRDAFKKDPAGVWPAEGSVSEQAVMLLAEHGVRWIGTDEGILWRSIRGSVYGSISREDLVYRPYETGGGGPAIFFRDHYLSDRIGFNYQSMEAGSAVEDFISYLDAVSSRSGEGEPVVTVILDGENPWAYYPDDGASFLEALYRRLEEEEWIETSTPSAVLEEGGGTGRLERLFPGSWIDSNFHIWIGDHAKNKAWKHLADVRNAVASAGCDEAARQEALLHVRAAEGSDWFWWYGEPNSSTEDPIFDQLFRSRLRAAMRAAGLEIPAALLKPGGAPTEPAPVVKSPLTFIHPGINGTGEKFFEWYNAGRYEIRQSSGEMAEPKPLFSTVFYGFDYDFIYVRMDPLATPSESIVSRMLGVDVRVVFDEEKDRWVEIALPSPVGVKLSGGKEGREGVQVAFDVILEAAVPIREFGLERGGKLNLSIVVMKNGIFVERYPRKGTFEFGVPDEKWDNYQWIV